MNNKQDERQQLITYKYGCHAYMITLLELAILLLLNAGLEPNSSGIETMLLQLLNPSMMIAVLLIPPLLYFYVRTTLSDGLPEAQRKQNIMYCPFAIIIYATMPAENTAFKYSVVIIFFVVWIISLYTYLRDKKRNKEIKED